MTKVIFSGALFFLLVGCGKIDDRPDQVEPTPDVAALYEEASTRLVSMLDRGFVVSRWADGRAEHRGDALIWSGISMASLSCAAGEGIETAILAMMDELEGGMYRHPDLADQISMDGAVGVYRGAASRMRRCPGSKEKWAPRLSAHIALGRLNPHNPAVLPAGFDFVPERLLAFSGVAQVKDFDQVALETAVIGWSAGVIAAREACYRVNLSYQTLRTLEETGLSVNRSAFCKVTGGADMPTVDHWCGRADLGPWIEGFQYNAWEYRHQRCPGWESQDGKPGLSTPAVDYLEALREKFAWPT